MGLNKMHSEKKARIKTIIKLLSIILVGIIILLYSFQRNIMFFVKPSEFSVAKDKYIDKIFRIYGLIKENSIKYDENKVYFTILDPYKTEFSIEIKFQGIIPPLFKEKNGIIAEGLYDYEKDIFIAEKLIAKHDENYIAERRRQK